MAGFAMRGARRGGPGAVLSALLVGLAACVAALLALLWVPSDRPPRQHDVAEALVWGALIAVAGALLAFRLRDASAWERRGRTAAEHGHDIIWETSPRGRITYISAAGAQALGYTPDELIGQDMTVLLPSDEVPAVHGRWSVGLDTASGWDNLLVRAVTKDGDEVIVRSTGIAMVNRRGRVVGFAGATQLLNDDEAQRLLVQEKRKRISEILAGDGLQIVAQPIVDLSSGAVLGAEMLSRFPSSPGRPPDAWFRHAADIGMLQDLELHALHRALAAAADLPEHLYVSVNISPTTLGSQQLPLTLALSDIDPSRIMLELTEHQAIWDYGPLEEALAALRSVGVRLAVDDAGAGYSSFRHILRLRPDCIKLDRAIVADIHRDAGRRALAAAIVMFALEMDASVIAEGIETDQEMSMLATLGLDAAQGFLLQRPTPDRNAWTAWANRPFAPLGASADGATSLG